MLAGKLVLVMAIHSLGGSRANRHHMPNQQPGAAQPIEKVLMAKGVNSLLKISTTTLSKPVR